MSSPYLRRRIGHAPVDGGLAFGSIQVQPAKPPASSTVSRLSGALSRIAAGVFGKSYPRDNSSAQVNTQVDVRNPNQTPDNNFYAYYEGDLFTPGTGNYVFQSKQELPIQTLWGYGFLYRANFMKSIQEPQVYGNQQIRINGIGGIVAGQFALAPLDTLDT